jgi:hypothetical protein
MTQEDEERAIAALISAGRTLNAWREPIQSVERELGMSTVAARAFVEELQHRGAVRIKGERATGLPRLHWWVRGKNNAAPKA